MKWQDIFKVMKGKNLKTGFSSSKDLIENWWIKQKLYKQAKVKKIQHYQISFTTNSKGNSLGRKHKKQIFQN